MFLGVMFPTAAVFTVLSRHMCPLRCPAGVACWPLIIMVGNWHGSQHILYQQYHCKHRVLPFSPLSIRPCCHWIQLDGGDVCHSVVVADDGTQHGRVACWPISQLPLLASPRSAAAVLLDTTGGVPSWCRLQQQQHLKHQTLWWQWAW